MTDTRYVVRISARYADDHQETSTLPGTELGRNARGVELELTIGQLVELVSRADYYADPHYGRELAESGYADLHRSAKKACEQIRRAGLWELTTTREAKDAYSKEWEAAMEAPRY